MKVYDCIVLGAGPAGLTASIYLSRYRLEHLIFGEVRGGQIGDAAVVENYPGFTSVSGPDLVQSFTDHAESYGVKVRAERIGEISKEDDSLPADRQVFVAKNEEGELFKTRSLILALGARHRPLNVPGEDQFLGKGVSYCTTCDAPLFKGKDVAVVGGGDSAIAAVIHLASYAKKVYVIHRRGEYRAAEAEVEKVRSLPNVKEVLDNTVKEIQGEKAVEKVILSQPYQGKKELSVQGVFVEIGLVPASSIAKSLGVEMDKHGHIRVTPAMETSAPGVFAAGDLSIVPGALAFRQIVTSAADGARAAAAVHRCLRSQEPVPDWG